LRKEREREREGVREYKYQMRRMRRWTIAPWKGFGCDSIWYQEVYD